MKNKMAVLERLYCSRCNRKFIDYSEGCPECLEYLYCSTVETKAFNFAARPSATKNEVVEMDVEEYLDAINGDGERERCPYCERHLSVSHQSVCDGRRFG